MRHGQPQGYSKRDTNMIYVSSTSYIAQLELFNLVTLYQEIRSQCSRKHPDVHNIENAECFVLEFLDALTE